MNVSKIKISTLIIAIIIYGCLTFITLIAYVANEEGTDGSPIIATSIIAKLFNIFRFPTHTLFFDYMNRSMFFIGLLINCIFYGFITERFISFYNHQRKTL